MTSQRRTTIAEVRSQRSEIRDQLGGSLTADRWPLTSGFTLIEVLVAMTVLSVMVLMVANIFQSSSAAWNIGTQKADMNTAARAALDFMVRELESAVAGPVEKAAGSGGADYLTFQQEAINDLRFLTMMQDPGGLSRALRGSYFWLEDQKLRYYRETDSLDCYTSELWHNSRGSGVVVGDLITNVLTLQFYVYTNEFALTNGIFAPNANMTHYQLPICVDIALEMLSDDDMLRYNQLGGADQAAFKERNAKLYSTRVYFPNRQGYQAR